MKKSIVKDLRNITKQEQAKVKQEISAVRLTD